MTITFDIVLSSEKHLFSSYTASDAIITQMSLSTNGDRTTETITIGFSKLTLGLWGAIMVSPDTVGFDAGHASG